MIYIGIHINPLKKRIVLVKNPNSEEYITKKEPMSWEDAAKISLVIMLAHIFMTFLTLYDWGRIVNNPEAFLFDLFKFAGTMFFGTFIVLTGLSRYFSK